MLSVALWVRSIGLTTSRKCALCLFPPTWNMNTSLLISLNGVMTTSLPSTRRQRPIHMRGLVTVDSFSTTATASPASGGSSCAIGKLGDCCWLRVDPSGGSSCVIGVVGDCCWLRVDPSGGSSCVIGVVGDCCWLRVDPSGGSSCVIGVVWDCCWLHVGPSGGSSCVIGVVWDCCWLHVGPSGGSSCVVGGSRPLVFSTFWSRPSAYR